MCLDSTIFFVSHQVFPDHELAMVVIGTIKGNGSGVIKPVTRYKNTIHTYGLELVLSWVNRKQFNCFSSGQTFSEVFICDTVMPLINSNKIFWLSSSRMPHIGR